MNKLTSTKQTTQRQGGNRRATALDEAFDIENIRRAWRWLRTNPDARYKNYFRDLYGGYAVIDEWYLNDLSDRLKRRIYEPSYSCKIYLPKHSGILRPYTLLTVEDQIVYQAMVNVVAEKLFPHVRGKYYIETFGNLYAGKTSVWFYKKWSDSYKKFNDVARDAVESGLRFSASFDLTACYDSLDHGVLTYFLNKMGCGKEFCDFLKKLLVKWTATDDRQHIYLNHGIPQGPLSSGLLSEVVLHYFDTRHRQQKNMKYFRYVDDIRLFASSPSELREALVRFDLLSKDIGLFPQSSKIEIHEVKDIEKELKSISNPVESSVKARHVNQEKLYRRILELSPRFNISNHTRFKYLLAHAVPSSKLSARLWRIYENNPSFYESMMRYFKRYDHFPNGLANRFLREIKTPQIYDAVLAALIDAAEDRFPRGQARHFHRAIKSLWRYSPNTLPLALQYSVGRWVLKYDLLKSIHQRKYALNLKSWYSRVSTTRGLDNNTLILPNQTHLLNNQLGNESDDVALIAAVLVFKRNIPILLQPQDINSTACSFLKEMGLISTTPSRLCGIEKSMTRLLGQSVAGIDWKTFFPTNYSRAEQLAISCRAYAGTDVTSWVNLTDSFNDLLLNELFLHDLTIGSYRLGDIGSVLKPTSRFAQKYPKTFQMAREFHKKRRDSELSHAFVRGTGKPTGMIRYSYLTYGKRLMKDAFIELLGKW